MENMCNTVSLMLKHKIKLRKCRMITSARGENVMGKSRGELILVELLVLLN